jgi:hypothetical protein
VEQRQQGDEILGKVGWRRGREGGSHSVSGRRRRAKLSAAYPPCYVILRKRLPVWVIYIYIKVQVRDSHSGRSTASGGSHSLFTSLPKVSVIADPPSSIAIRAIAVLSDKLDHCQSGQSIA